MDTLLQLALDFSVISLLSVGGMTAGLPELERRLVVVDGFMSGRTFVELYGLGYAMPGPNVMVATLLGFHVGGVAGALVATVAIALPSAVFASGVARLWHRFRDARWRRVTERGLLAMTVGLTFAGGYLVTRSAAQAHWTSYLVTLATLVLVLRFPKLNPLWLIAAGAALGLAGVL